MFRVLFSLRLFVSFIFILFEKIPHFRLLLLVIAIIAVSNANPIELGHYASPVYAPVAKAILPEPIVSVDIAIYLCFGCCCFYC